MRGRHLCRGAVCHLSIGTLHTLRVEVGVTRKRVVERKVCGSLERVEALRLEFRATTTRAQFNSAVAIDECHFRLQTAHGESAPRGGFYGSGKFLKKIFRLEEGARRSPDLRSLEAEFFFILHL